VSGATTVASLVDRSIAIIRAGQHPSGGYAAAPGFPPYEYSWLRDGSFIADAMSRNGETDSAEAFFDWAARIVGDGRGFDARYTLEGDADPTNWPHRQLDGWGLWLWAVAEHCGRHGVDRVRWGDAAEATCDYLEREWRHPCTDWWEERVGLHRATLACVEAGLLAWGIEGVDVWIGEDRVDASQLCLVWPFSRPEATTERIRSTLVSPGGGVHRHLDDEYYGGGEWLLLTALLGLAELEEGDEDAARTRLAWVAERAEPNGNLPEQTREHVLHPNGYESWVDRWGPPPSPLLWSHAMFIDLALELGADE
jgi:GH15 family glucan-1,4-alpha-glucosidase